MGSYYLRQWHMRWFLDHAEEGVRVRDISDATVGFSLVGPRSREVLSQLTQFDLGNESLPLLGCATMDVGLIRAKVARLSVCGELGYEINCAMDEHITLRENLLEAGQVCDIREFGSYAMNSFRLEKSFGVWSAEFTQAYIPGMTGLDRWIDWSREDFIGREAARKERQEMSARERLVTLEVDADDADASGYEPVWEGGRRVGFVTSGGFGHYIGKSLAMALVDRVAMSNDRPLDVHVVGKRLAARIIRGTPLGPRGCAPRRLFNRRSHFNWLTSSHPAFEADRLL